MKWKTLSLRYNVDDGTLSQSQNFTNFKFMDIKWVNNHIPKIYIGSIMKERAQIHGSALLSLIYSPVVGLTPSPEDPFPAFHSHADKLYA